DFRTDERERRPDVAGERERGVRAREQPELVQRDQRREAAERKPPPAADVRQAEHRRQEHECDEDPREECAQRPPNRRRRDAYSASAPRRSRSSKSGQYLSTNTSSEYATCQSRKFEMRSSPLVRISRSGSGSSGA